MPFNLGLGLGLSRRAVLSGSAPAFSPADLFAASEPGFYARVQTSDLWQDVARTTPVTAAGQEVLSWRLRTAGADIYAEQATAGNGPVYQVDGDGAGYLDFGSSKSLVTPNIVPGGVDKVQVFLAYNQFSGIGGFGVIVEASANSETNAGTWGYITTADGTGRQVFAISRGTATAQGAHPARVPNNLKTVCSLLGDISAPSVTFRENGTVIQTSTATQGTGAYLTYPVFIGRRGGSGISFQRRMYGLLVRYGPNLTTQQITDAEAWGASTLNP